MMKKPFLEPQLLLIRYCAQEAVMANESLTDPWNPDWTVSDDDE